MLEDSGVGVEDVGFGLDDSTFDFTVRVVHRALLQRCRVFDDGS
jgi:hypothetical protein